MQFSKEVQSTSVIMSPFTGSEQRGVACSLAAQGDCKTWTLDWTHGLDSWTGLWTGLMDSLLLPSHFYPLYVHFMIRNLTFTMSTTW